VETGTTSSVSLLAADRPQRFSLACPTSPLETRVRGFSRRASGRFSFRHRKTPINTPGLRGCGYKTASGRGKWLSRDPIGEPGFETLRHAGKIRRWDLNIYALLNNNPLNGIDALGLIGLPTDLDSVSRSIWSAIWRGNWDEALSLIEDSADSLGDDVAQALERGVKQMRGLDKWRKQMSGWCRKDLQQQLKTLEKTLQEHLEKDYRNGTDDGETMRLRYMIEYIKGLLK